MAIVLAPAHYLHLLWPTLSRSPLPRLLPAALLPPARRGWRISRTLLLVTSLRYMHATPTLPAGLYAISRVATQLYSCVHLESPEPRDSIELPRVVGIYRAVFTMGVDGVQHYNT